MSERSSTSSAADVSGHTCPSTTLDHGDTLIGVVGSDNQVHFVSPPLPVDDDFRAAAERTGRAERRFRFSGACIEDGCEQWSDGRCGVIDAVTDAAGSAPVVPLSRCAIRRSRRWFDQHGADACRICPLVVTDGRDALAPR